MLVNVSLKLIVLFSTRPETDTNVIRALAAHLETWTGDELEAVLHQSDTIVRNDYDLEVIDFGVTSPGERRWDMYPGRVVVIDTNNTNRLNSRLDQYQRNLQTEIRRFFDADVSEGIGNESWHIHLSTGSVDEVN